MAEIIPAIMPDKFGYIKEDVKEVKGLVPFVQIDIMDGDFVEGKTWPYKNDFEFSDIVEGEKFLPYWKDIEYELDMMIRNPQDKFKDWVSAGISRFILHLNSVDDITEPVKIFNDLYRLDNSLLKTELLVAVPFDASVSTIKNIENKIDGVQVMGISPVGVQGSSFKEEAIETIKNFRKAYPDLKISIDGGVKKEMVGIIINAGADRLVMGSEIFEELSPRDELRNILDNL